MTTYRVVQWATGNIGTRALRGGDRAPGARAGGRVRPLAEDKAGRDAGELCGLGPTGVAATNDIDEVVGAGRRLRALHAPRARRRARCAGCSSGANVVTTRGEFHHPPCMDPALRARVEAACAEGGTSIHSTGSSPGFISEAVPLVLTSIQRRLDRLTIDEFADLSRRHSPDLLFDDHGLRQAPRRVRRRRGSRTGATSFGPSLRAHRRRARAAARRRRGRRRGGGRSPRRRDRRRHARGGHRRRPAADGDGRAGRQAAAAVPGQLVLHHRARPGVGPRPTGWRVAVEGDAPLDVDHALPGADRADGRDVARLHRPPGGQRRARACARPRRASAPRSISRRSSPPWADPSCRWRPTCGAPLSLPTVL